MDRIAALTEILTANPEDSFARYGLALEYSKAGEIERALQEFKTLIEKNPDYTPAYFMAHRRWPALNASRRPSACWWMASPARAAPGMLMRSRR
ncbi:MAG: tetratricopeptide repeat protein [Terriglobales bacterium]